MKITDWQADDVLPTATMRWIGGLRTYAQRSQFFFGFFKTVVLAVLSYESVQGYTLQTSLPTTGTESFLGYTVSIPQTLTVPVGAWFWPTMLHWVAVVFIAGGLFVAVDRLLFHPAQITYNQHQNGDEERSPNYRETMENQRRINQLNDRLDELLANQTRTDGGQTTMVAPACSDCHVDGVRDTHKGEPCIACPDCGDILYRNMEVGR
jgi:hypothetical protein